ncbi:MAG TPA: glutamate racemase [Bacillales bacterium]|nr:glutamate racemase [Bacillales bacterium]
MDKPIGVMDSGVGGLTVVRELNRQLPKEEIVYFGDTLRCPYGSRSPEEVKDYTWEMTKFLQNLHVKMLVIACNTATAFVLEEIKTELDIPVVGVIHPGARSAIKVTKNNRVGVIGTEGTINSGAYFDALKNINPDIVVESVACPLFVPMVENGSLSGLETEKTIRSSLSGFSNFDMDTLILGCTHYPLLREAIQQVVGPEVQLICSGIETAREVSTVLHHSSLLFTGEREPAHRLFTSGRPALFARMAKQWLDVPFQIEPAVLSQSMVTHVHGD